MTISQATNARERNERTKVQNECEASFLSEHCCAVRNHKTRQHPSYDKLHHESKLFEFLRLCCSGQRLVEESVLQHQEYSAL